MRTFLAACLIVLFVTPLAAGAAAAVPNPVLRLTVAAEPPPLTFWQRLARLLGARLAPGTTLAVTSTAYAPSPYQTDSTPCITAAGTRVRPGTVAANWLPLGTLLNINGEVYIVEDRMHPRYQRSIDIFFPTTEQALAFGRRLLTVSVIGYGSPGQPIREAAKEKLAPKKATSQKASAKKAPAKPAPTPSESVSVVRPTIGTRTRLAWYALRYYLQSVTARRQADVNRFDVNCFTDQS